MLFDNPVDTQYAYVSVGAGAVILVVFYIIDCTQSLQSGDFAFWDIFLVD